MGGRRLTDFISLLTGRSSSEDEAKTIDLNFFFRQPDGNSSALGQLVQLRSVLLSRIHFIGELETGMKRIVLVLVRNVTVSP